MRSMMACLARATAAARHGRWSALAAAMLLGLTACTEMQAQLAKPRGAKILDSRPEQLAGASIDPRFALHDGAGRPVTEADFSGRPWLIYFGYTSCSQICGLELQTMAAVADALPGGTDQLGLIFVTVDPARDTPERLRAFTEFFHPRLVGLRGSETETGRAARAFGAYFRRHDGEMLGYGVDHSSFIYLVDAAGRFARAFPYDTDPQTIVAALGELPPPEGDAAGIRLAAAAPPPAQ